MAAAYDKYSSAAALEALEAHTTASRDVDSTPDLVARAARWRSSVLAQAAQLADWEQPPDLPDNMPLAADALKMLLNDAGRILGAVACLGELVKGGREREGAANESEGGAPSADNAEEVAGNQQLIIDGLRQQLRDAKAAQQQAEARAEKLERQMSDTPASVPAGGGEGSQSGRRRSTGRVNLLPHGS